MTRHAVRRSNRLHGAISIVLGLGALANGWAAHRWYDAVLIVGGGALVALGIALLIHPLAFESTTPGED